MTYLWAHALSIIHSYNGSVPLSIYLKAFTSAHPRLGSRDRRMLADVVYSWYRASCFLPAGQYSERDALLQCLAICQATDTLRRLTESDRNNQSSEKKDDTDAVSNTGTHMPQTPARQGSGQNNEPAATQTHPGYMARAMPALPLFSEGITRQQWTDSLLKKPRTFLRIRPGYSEKISELILASGILHEWLSRTCLALPPATDVAKLLPEISYAVQDASSQQTGQCYDPKQGEQWWDCCCGAGGKTLLLLDMQPAVDLLCTDIRPAILHNLQQRIQRYRLPKPLSFLADASLPDALNSKPGSRKFDAILCDAPCSGSGTWARTPEQFYFFKPKSIAEYAKRQAAILHAIAPYLKPGGRIIYTTCSVFRQENEEVVSAAAKENGLSQEQSQLINGTAFGADSLYVSVLRKP